MYTKEVLEELARIYLGKICTILTAQTSLPIKDSMSHGQYFTGEVRRIDDSGIWIKHVQTKTMSFFSFPVIGIVEEQVVLPTDPRHEKIKQEVEKQSKPKSPYIDVSELTANLRKNKLQ